MDQQGAVWWSFGGRIGKGRRHQRDATMIRQIALRASTAPVTAHTDRQQYVPQFTQSGRQQKQTPYRHRLTGRLVQQGLSVAGDVRECIEFGSATDKRYSLGRNAECYADVVRSELS